MKLNTTAAFLFSLPLSKIIWTSQNFDLPRIVFDPYLEDWGSILFSIPVVHNSLPKGPRFGPRLQSHYLQLKLLSGKNVRAWVSMDFTQDKFSAPIAIEKIKILGAPWELLAKQHCQSSPFTSNLGQIGQIGSAV